MAIGPLLLASAAVTGAAAWWWSHRERTSALRAIRSTPATRIAEARAGEIVRIVGRICAETTIVAPLSGIDCVGFRAEADEKMRVWIERARQQACVDFVVEDPTGRARVRARRAELVLAFDFDERSGTWNDASPALEAFLAAHGHSSRNFLGLNRILRYREGALVDGARVAAVGIARWEDDPDGERDVDGGYRDARRKQRLVIDPGEEPVRVSNERDALR